MPEPSEMSLVNTNKDPTNWIKIEPSTGKLFKYNPSTGSYDREVPYELGDVNFQGKVVITGDEGITGTFDSKKHYIRKLKVKNGIVVELEVEPLE